MPCDSMSCTVQSSRRKGGFTLVETALALLVVAVGLMGVFALFPAGMQSSHDAVKDTEISMIADSVFAELQMRTREDFDNWEDKFSFDPIVPNGDYVELKDESAFPIATCRLEVQAIKSGELVEATLRCRPGLQTDRVLTFYRRYANYR